MATNKDNSVTMPLNYVEIKQKYMDLINENIELMNKHPLSTDKKIQDKITKIQSMEATEPDLAVLNLASKTKLYRKRDNLLLEVLSVAESFDVILKTHVTLGHTGAAIVYKELLSKLSIPTFAVSWVISACNVCEHRRNNKTTRPLKVKEVTQKVISKPVKEPEPIPSPSEPQEPQPETSKVTEPLSIQPVPKLKARRPAGKQWRLNLLKHSSLPQSSNSRACYLLILRQIDTNFIILRPVFESSMELSLELMKIFTEFGYPSKLYVSKLIKKYVWIIQTIYAANPVAHVEVELAKDTSFFNEDEMEVIMEIHKWMDMMSDAYWDQCLPMVQYKINTKKMTFMRMDTKEISIGIPFELFFNFKPSTEIKWINPKTKEVALDYTSNIDDEIANVDLETMQI